MLTSDDELLRALDYEQLVSLKSLRAMEGGLDGTQAALDVSWEILRRTEEKARRQAVAKYIWVGEEGMTAEEIKSLRSDPAPLGGYLISPPPPTEFLVKPSAALLNRLCTHRTLTTGDAYPVPLAKAGPTVAFYSETEDIADDTTLALSNEMIPLRNMATRLVLTSREVEAVGEGLTQRLIDAATPAFEEKLDAEIVIGDGVRGLEGVLTAAGIPQTVSGNSSTFTADSIRTMFFDLKPQYRSNSTWVMNSATADLVRGLKTTDGLPIYSESLGGIFGRPIAISESAPDVGAGSLPIILADWRFYYVVTRQELSIFRNPFRRKPFVLFDLVKRIGGQCILPEAFRLMKIST